MGFLNFKNKEKVMLQEQLAEKERLIQKLTNAMEDMVKMARQLNENNKKLTQMNDQLIAINNTLLSEFNKAGGAQNKAEVS